MYFPYDFVAKIEQIESETNLRGVFDFARVTNVRLAQFGQK